MITIELMGGLGNQLFQLAFLHYIHKQTNCPIYLHKKHIHTSAHSQISYLDTIFKHWQSYVLEKDVSMHTIVEYKLHPQNWTELAIEFSRFQGYFQHYKYILDDFIHSLSFDTERLNAAYPDVSNAVFLHIRGGDYIQNPVFKELFDVDLTTYYENAIKQFPQNTMFYVFTNDISYATTFKFLRTITHRLVLENEVDSLYLMSQCKGGICANSSFSWWGGYLNKSRQIIIPSKWFNDPNYYTDGLNVPEWSVNKWGFIDKVVYINLDHRTDRNEHMKRITSVFPNVMRLPALQHEKGYIGCALSHISVLKIAIQCGWKNLLVLEDDVEWNETINYNLLNMLVSRPYDVILLGGGSVIFDRNTYKVTSAQCASSYLVHHTYFNTMLSTFEEALRGLIETNNAYHYAIDMFWKRLQPNDNWYFVSPCILYQKPDYSDIEKNVVDYRGGMHIVS